MGLFDSKVTFTAYAGSSVLIPEEERKNTVLSLMLQGILTSSASPPESILIGLQTNLYARAKSMVRYADRPDGYYYGLPEATHNGDDRYLPIAVLMHDRVWWDEEDPATDDPLEYTTYRLLKRLNINPYEVKETYIEEVEAAIESGERPGEAILDEWDFFIQFAVPMHTEIRGSLEYIFYFLKFLPTVNQWTTRAEYEAYLAGGQIGDQPSSNFHLSEGEGSDKDWQVTATGYEVYYAWSYIESVIHEGEYTPPGATEPLQRNRMYSKVYQFGAADYAEGIEEVHGAGAAIATSEPEAAYHDYAVFTRQSRRTDGSYFYEQVLIMAPTMMWVINTPEGGETAQIQYVDAPLFPEDPDELSEFRWPVHINVMKEVATMHREEMLQDALCATVFLVDKQQVKWYQTGFFKWLIIIIVIIIIILAWQYELLPGIATLAGAATGATALALWALYVVLTFAIGFLVSFAGGLIGGTLGKLFVIVGMYMAMGGGFSAGNNPFTSSWSNLTTMPTTWGAALQYVQSVSNMLQIGQQFYGEYKLHKLEDQMKDFEKTAKEKYNALQDAWDTLGDPPNNIDGMDLARAFMSTGVNEDPDEYYYRTLNANPGVLGYDLIYSFTEMALLLPEKPGSPGIIDNMMEQFAEQRGQA